MDVPDCRKPLSCLPGGSQQQGVSPAGQASGLTARARHRPPGVRQRVHWLVKVARDAQLSCAEVLHLPANTATKDAWTLVSQSCGVDAADLARHVAATYRLEVANLSTAAPQAVKLLPASVALMYQVFPLREDNRHLFVATGDPVNLDAEQAIGFASGRTPVMEVAPPPALEAAILREYASDSAVEGLLQHVDEQAEDWVRVIDTTSAAQVTTVETESGPVVKLTNLILRDAVKQGASDIHLQPGTSGGVVRFRVDGVLRHYMQLPRPVLDRVVSRIKILGKLDIANRLKPQDGRASLAVGPRTLDLRISTVPTRDSEKAVIRLLDSAASAGLDTLGLTSPALQRFRSLLSHKEGIVVVTGPTGSGKTTTLYAALQELSTADVNVISVEDPVEYELPGITQVQVESKQGVTFASALRSMLRQDPDIIFVGEIRDSETAAVAVEASLTGHLVLTTLHTNDAVGTIRRLTDLGLDRSAIIDTFRGAAGQRLVRRVCSHCSVPIDGDNSGDATPGGVAAVRARGCDECGHSGYRGRLPLVEVFVMSVAFEQLLAQRASASRLNAQAIADGMRPLREVALDRVRDGDTTFDEFTRVLGSRGDEDPNLASADDRTTQQTASAVPAVGPSLKTRRGMGAQPADAEHVHVLLVDDDAASRAMARALLERIGYRVSEAPDGAAALELLKIGDYSLMVLDLDMPILSGHEVLARVRSSVTTAGLPIIVLTDSADTEIQVMDDGADDYIHKPIDPPRFVARVKAALRRAAG